MIDASDPLAPVRVARLDIGSSWLPESSTSGIARSGATLLTSYSEVRPDLYGFAAWDVQDPLGPELRWAWDTGGGTDANPAIGLTTADSLAVFLWFNEFQGEMTISRYWLAGDGAAYGGSTASTASAIAGAPGRVAVHADRFPARVLRYGQEVPERWESTLDGVGGADISAHFDSGIPYTKSDHGDSAWTIVDASNPRAPEIIGDFGVPGRKLRLPVIEGDRGAAIGGDDRILFFDLSKPRDPRFVSEMVIENVSLMAIGRKATQVVPRNRWLEGRHQVTDRYYLHTYGEGLRWNRPADHVFQSGDMSDLDAPVWLGRWKMDMPFSIYEVECLEAVGDVGVFAASYGGGYVPCETQFATWVAEPDAIRPVEWRITNDTVVAMATHGPSLVLANTCMPYGYCESWMSAYEVDGDGRLAAPPAHCCSGGGYSRHFVSDPDGIFYRSIWWDLNYYSVWSVALDARGEIERRHMWTTLLDDCGLKVAPIAGALVAACRDDFLRIQPSDYTTRLLLLGEWVEGGARRIEGRR